MGFAVDVCGFCRSLPAHAEARDVVRQLRRAASSTAANYRASKRGRSDAEFISKVGQAIEEADESLFWLEFGIVAILTASQKTAKVRRTQRKQAKKAFSVQPSAFNYQSANVLPSSAWPGAPLFTS